MVILSTIAVYAVTQRKLYTAVTFIAGSILIGGFIILSQLNKTPLENKCAKIESASPALFSALEEAATKRSGKPTKCTDLQSQDELDDILSSVKLDQDIQVDTK
jgi:hypothetical protein